MALGGVATGSINAQEAAKVKGKMSSVTGILILTATAAKIGTSSAVLAVLLDSSVRKMTKTTMMPKVHLCHCVSTSTAECTY